MLALCCLSVSHCCIAVSSRAGRYATVKGDAPVRIKRNARDATVLCLGHRDTDGGEFGGVVE